MRLYWMSLWQSARYRLGSEHDRRMMEIRFSLAKTLRTVRKRRHWTQQQLADRIRAAQPTISLMERGSARVSIDLTLRALIVLGLSDDDIALAFNAGARTDVRRLRYQASRRFYPRPGADIWYE